MVIVVFVVDDGVVVVKSAEMTRKFVNQMMGVTIDLSPDCRGYGDNLSPDRCHRTQSRLSGKEGAGYRNQRS